MSKLYTVMKNNEKIKTARSLNAAKEIADQEQAEVFCDGECVYTASQAETQATQATPIQAEPKAAEKPAEKPTENVAEKPAIAEKPVEKAATEAKPVAEKKVMQEEPLLGVALQTKEPQYDLYVLTSLMNVRNKPSLDANVIRTMPKGSIVHVLRIENDWLCIKNGSSEAFIYYKGGEFAKKVKINSQ